MAEIPKTSTSLLAAIAASSECVRWTDFYDRYHPVLESYLMTAFPSLPPDDVIQETMIVLMKKLPDYRYDPADKGLFRNFLIGIAKFKAIEALRNRKREADKRNGYREEIGDGESVVSEGMDEREYSDWRHAAYETAVRQLMLDEGIKVQNREIFRRVAVNGESPESVAAAYGVTRNNVDQVKNRMIVKLRERVRELLNLD